jgi:hypothetical protein
MTTPPTGTGAAGGPRRTLSRPRRLAFAAGLALVLYLVTEALVFSVGALHFGGPSWIAATQERRLDLVEELHQRDGLFLQVHPYVGYVAQPPTTVGGDTNGRRRNYPVSPYGYADRASPIRTRDPEKVIIAITGGSVAWSFHMHGADRLRARLLQDPAFRGKSIEFVNLAVSGYKQPQQLMTLNYLLVLGAQFDTVINIDGFNEAALYEAENAPHHVFPAFPRSWHLRVETSGPRISRYRGLVESEAERQLELARGFSRPPWRYSPLANLLWWIADAHAETALRRVQEEYRSSAEAMAEANYAVVGPGTNFPSRAALYEHLVALWKNSSVQLNGLCAANGIRYYHFLQPNLFLAGSKPLTAPEQHMANHRDLAYRPGVLAAYPRMIAAGRDLAAQGEHFTDLTRIFATHPEGLYVDICHLNQAGNNLLADRVAAALLER